MRILFFLLLGILLALVPDSVLAQPNTCPLGSFVPCGGGGVSGMANYAVVKIIPAMRVIFVAIAIGMFFYYAGTLLLESGEEQTITEVKSAYLWAVAGAGLVSLASFVVNTFGPSPDTYQTLTYDDASGPTIRTGFLNVIYALKLVLATVATAHLTIQGVRLIFLMGQEGELEKQKKRFFYGLMGIVIILLANAIINSVVNVQAPALASEISGIANFLLVLIGGGAVLSIIASGALLVVSVDEGLKDRAKKGIFGSIIALIIVLVAYTVVNYFLRV